MIFNRSFYERYEGRGEYDDYLVARATLSTSERDELIAFLSDRNPSEYRNALGDLPMNLARVARFHLPLSKEVEIDIRMRQKARRNSEATFDMRLTNEEIVEDSGLDETVTMKQSGRRAA